MSREAVLNGQRTRHCGHLPRHLLPPVWAGQRGSIVRGQPTQAGERRDGKGPPQRLEGPRSTPHTTLVGEIEVQRMVGTCSESHRHRSRIITFFQYLSGMAGLKNGVTEVIFSLVEVWFINFPENCQVHIIMGNLSKRFPAGAILIISVEHRRNEGSMKDSRSYPPNS